MHPTALDTLQRLLDTGDDPGAGAALHALYAPGAFLYVDGTVVRRDHVEAAAYAEAFAGAEPLDAGRRPAWGALSLFEARQEEEGLIAWFELAVQGGPPCTVAAGFQPEGEGLAVDWLTMAKAVRPITYAEGRAQMLGDYAYGEGGRFKTPRSWLDIGYYRHHGHPRPPLLIEPEARFGCQSSTGCCKGNFRIEVPQAAQPLIDAIGWVGVRPDLVGTQLQALDNGNLLLKDAGEVCRFLDERNMCSVHKVLGRAVFAPCSAYPFMFSATPDGVVVSASFACEAVRGNCGPLITERADDLYDRMAMGIPDVPETYRLTPTVEGGWETFQEAEDLLLWLLDQKSLPLSRRLWVGARALQNWDDLHGGIHPDFEQEPIEEAEGPMRGFQQAMLKMICVGFPLEDLHNLEDDLWHDDRALPDEARLMTLMRTLYRSKKYSFYMNLAATHNLAIALYVLALHAQARSPNHPDLMEQLSLMVLNGRLLTRLFHLMGPDWRQFVEDPSFGLGLLGFPRTRQAEPTAP